MKKYSFLAAVIALGAAAPVVEAAGPSYPERPVRVLVGLAPGGGTDSVTRVITTRLAVVLGQPFVVDNRPSAGGNVAGELAARAAPDGYTLITVTPTHVVNPSLYRDLRYDAIKDFAPVSLIVHAQYYLSVANSVPVTTAKELIALAKTRNPRLSYASSGIGSANHLSGELFKSMAGIEMVHVPYKGGAPALAALISGEIQVSFTSGVAIGHAKAGRLKTLAVTGPKRTPIAPDIPTIAESGVPGYAVTGWYGMAAPAKTPKAVIERLNTTINRLLPELRERYANLGMDLGGGTAEEFGAHLKSERDKWAHVVKLSGAKVE
ncbi:MAG: tripartite tricarboxylate transporter substrate binding protein [Betaproteobacteria bacterium]|nr:tripartite tricarboxylate transporter substrate binding protein [Betaproteobacteria bacterium]